MRARGVPAVLLLAFSLTSVSGCAPVYNYLDDSGPRYARGCAGPAADGTIRVVSFNIKYARQIDRAIELLRTSGPLRDADVIALQEMDASGVERIAEALGLGFVYYPAAVHPMGRKDFGNAVLVRGEIEGDHKLVLPHPGRFGGMRRIAVAVTARIAGQRLRIYSTHLGTPKDVSASARRDQVAAIVADALSAEGPVVVAGDFNNRALVAAAFEQAGYGWVTRQVGRTISFFSWDHVFVRGFELKPEPRSGVSASQGASDHRPVWVDLPLQPVLAPSAPLAADAQPLGAPPAASASTALLSATPPIR